jgi:hypothetical protein
MTTQEFSTAIEAAADQVASVMAKRMRAIALEAIELIDWTDAANTLLSETLIADIGESELNGAVAAAIETHLS